MKKLLDHDPLTGVSTIFHHDPHTDQTVLETVQDIEPHLEINKKLQNEHAYTKHGFKEEFWHYAHIPDSIILKWRVELGVDVYDPNDKKKVFALLNDPEYRYLKTTSLFHAPKN